MTPTEPAPERPRPPGSAADARARVRDLLHADGGPAPSRAVTDDILLVVTELITNAQRHGGGLTAFEAVVADGVITITVADASPLFPRASVRDGSPVPGGFGWPLVQRLSCKVSVLPAPDGKTIRVVMGTGRGAELH
ncbi:ATP-binding protein [Streptomyces sp. J2-1]|uniref:ATP-binding protein n=1 Tax=Streptomyces corallincola TaxID=2851888 RepID=UPI001C39435E|nr:ATP-binding protein [Streptomyces corallincola]MBV2354119.1 ATP-binding protein [Streptomyces corallincola]